jgi:hypothetical protein
MLLGVLSTIDGLLMNLLTCAMRAAIDPGFPLSYLVRAPRLGRLVKPGRRELNKCHPIDLPSGEGLAFIF